MDEDRLLNVSFAAAMALLDRAEYMKKRKKEKEAIDAAFEALPEEVINERNYIQ